MLSPPLGEARALPGPLPPEPLGTAGIGTRPVDSPRS